MNKKLFLLFTIAIFFILPVVIYAQGFDWPGWLQGVFNRIFNLVWVAFAALVTIMFVFAGFRYLTGRGDPAKITEANKALMWAIVGTAVGLLSMSVFSIVKWILNFQ